MYCNKSVIYKGGQTAILVRWSAAKWTTEIELFCPEILKKLVVVRGWPADPADSLTHTKFQNFPLDGYVHIFKELNFFTTYITVII
jgi:hypothetical protein